MKDISTDAAQRVGQAMQALIEAMNALAADVGCHGWQMQAFACEGYTGKILSPAFEIDLIQIEAYREIAPDVDGRGCVEYEIKELASVFVGDDGSAAIVPQFNVAQ